MADAPVAAPVAHRAGRTISVSLVVNGQRRDVEVDPRVTLLDLLRDRLHLTGSKKGCGLGQCGACTVLLNNRPVNACLTLAAMAQNATVVTIEGISGEGDDHPLQRAFVRHDALQCGYCTPGQIMAAMGLFSRPDLPSDAEIREYMSGNICRCGAYTNIVAAVRQALIERH